MNQHRTLPALGVVAVMILAVLVLATACGGEGITGGGASAAPTPASSTVFDTGKKTVSRLDPDLLAALDDAAEAAERDGVELTITSGWRSRAHQRKLFDAAIAKYGSEKEARRWVSTPDTSAHVTGDAVDIGPTEAADWLGRHGAAYGLCQTFANEMWHFELATKPGGTCPPQLPDSSYRQ